MSFLFYFIQRTVNMYGICIIVCPDAANLSIAHTSRSRYFRSLKSLTTSYSHHLQSVSTLRSECRHVYLMHLGYAGTPYRDSFSFRNEKISGK